MKGSCQLLRREMGEADCHRRIMVGHEFQPALSIHLSKACHRSQADPTLPVIEECVAEWPLHIG